eukprot:TRINITY_DN49898_c0_g1_i1.p1 TRINITY_DN49898_c0_g1~~TRINITY_DN49898_c0_g1_i1.p1  ORF type:complete len:220 (+),score=24.88 TRINITY_DN49898_c0_g1_i1:86-745(+)
MASPKGSPSPRRNAPGYPGRVSNGEAPGAIRRSSSGTRSRPLASQGQQVSVSASASPTSRGPCSFSVSPRAASRPSSEQNSSARRAVSTEASAIAAAQSIPAPPEEMCSTMNAWSAESAYFGTVAVGGTVPRSLDQLPSSGGAVPSKAWREALGGLQREYAEVLRGIDRRLADRMDQLDKQLDSSRKHELPPSYPPSDVSCDKPASEPEMVETDPECSP